ncbi:hypothetical protein [Streptococcus pantholopis]|uniref:Uncharacterized protein n=1 Tax=Streptococcus pantholopis TaxID=1811193 RepID=A0A172Q5D0_9STRE|nr:hypothetical protein [Streptococcus pantholopis]AND78656.1 hypothetical protein A0O21_00745 [Streptococcus pantholopis]
MIYLIQPLFYKTDLEIIIQDYLKQKYPSHRLVISHHIDFPLLSKVNLFFIIHDSTLKDWDGIQQSKYIRFSSNSYSNQIILVADQLNYTMIFRTHISFLGVISSKELDKNEICQYIDDYMSYQSNIF